MQSSGPALVIVSGAPASGKSTLARRLADDLRLPLLSKDVLKERLADSLGAPMDVPASSRLGAASYAVLYHVATCLLAAGTAVMVESNFRRGLSENDLRPLLATASGLLVHCAADPAVLERRYRRRHLSGERHVAHLDGARAAALADDLATGRFEPLALELPVLRVEFDGEWHPAYEEIREIVAGRIPA